MTHTPASLFCALTMVLSTGALWAQGGLHDPTRPPSNVDAKARVSSGSATADNIQMLVIGRERSFAMLDGEVVMLGGTFNQWQLISMDSQSVVMRNATLTEEINLNPSVAKTLRTAKRSDSSRDAVDPPASRKIP